MTPISRQASRCRGLRSYVIRACRRILRPENEPTSLPVRALRRLFGDYLQVRAEGRELIVDLRDTVVSYGIIADATWEPAETTLFRALLRPGDVALDIGAHIGYYSTLFARLVGPTGRVFSYEPDADNFALLCENARLGGADGIIVARRAAVGERSGTATLVRTHETTADHLTANRGAHHISQRAGTSAGTTVEVVSIDGDIPAGVRVSVVKMDVEGFEAAAARGMRRTLEVNADIVVVSEFWPAAIRRAGDDPDAYLALMRSHGFEMWEIAGTAGLKRTDGGTLLRSLTGPGDQTDLVFIRPATARSRQIETAGG